MKELFAAKRIDIDRNVFFTRVKIDMLKNSSFARPFGMFCSTFRTSFPQFLAVAVTFCPIFE